MSTLQWNRYRVTGISRLADYYFISCNCPGCAVSCMRCAKLKGSGARSNGPGEAPAEPSCPLRPIKKEKARPSGLQGGALLLFPGMGSRERSGLEPIPVLPIPNPMDEVRGGKMFWCQLNSRFEYGQIRNLGSYVKTKGVPQRVAGRRPAAFSRYGIALSEASVILCRFFPFPTPWTKSMGVKCFGVSRIRDLGGGGNSGPGHYKIRL